MVIERWRLDYNQVRPHSAHAALTPEAVRQRTAGDALRNPGQLRPSPATTLTNKPLSPTLDSHYP